MAHWLDWTPSNRKGGVSRSRLTLAEPGIGTVGWSVAKGEADLGSGIACISPFATWSLRWRESPERVSGGRPSDVPADAVRR